MNRAVHQWHLLDPYDAEGNRSRRTGASDGRYEVYSYDHRNRLTRVAFYDANDQLGKSVDYAYDLFNRLVRRTVDPDGDGLLAATDRFFTGFDGLQPTLEFDGPTTDGLAHRFLWGPAVDQTRADEQLDNGTRGSPLVLGYHIRDCNKTYGRK